MDRVPGATSVYKVLRYPAGSLRTGPRLSVPLEALGGKQSRLSKPPLPQAAEWALELESEFGRDKGRNATGHMFLKELTHQSHFLLPIALTRKPATIGTNENKDGPPLKSLETRHGNGTLEKT